VSDPSKQLDLFPTSEPEIKGQLAAFAIVLRGLIETLIANGSLTKEQAVTLLRETDVKAAFTIWDELQGEMPDAELRRMEEQATRFLESLRREISERSK
jgi:polyhydroxyalkanoate synthesis regulator phasin